LFKASEAGTPAAGFGASPFGATLIVAASVGLLSFIVFGPLVALAASVENAASSEIREVLRFSSTAPGITGLGAAAPILTVDTAVAGLILIVFGPSGGCCPGVTAFAISRGIFEVSRFGDRTVLASAVAAGARIAGLAAGAGWEAISRGIFDVSFLGAGAVGVAGVIPGGTMAGLGESTGATGVSFGAPIGTGGFIAI